ncbi:MAG: sensor histidine kinase/response regulator, partial [Myxococcaceae bacterium]|nr:sensor histidine kinase/response regulator [Myxococcaceae bacterium]
AAGGAYASEHRLRRGDGTYAWMASRAVPIGDAGPAREWVGTMADVSDRVRVEEARAAEARGQRRLVVAERMASVGTLAAGVAHEINNPLAYMIVNLDLMIDELVELGGGATAGRFHEIEGMARDAREGAERVRRIVRGLKTFARPDAESVTVVDLHEVLETSIDIALEQTEGGARIVREFGSVPLVEADDVRLGQVFINLLVNAAQAMPAGDAGDHDIHVVTTTDAAGRAVAEVRDSGPGIPPEVLGRIFDPFFTTKPVGVGTGLGLSICHNIVTGMGGEITVASRPGEGTVFRVALPPAAASLVPRWCPPGRAAPST